MSSNTKIIGHIILPKEDSNKNILLPKLKDICPNNARICCIDNDNNVDILNGYLEYVKELKVDFSEDRLILILEKNKNVKSK